MFDQDMLSHAMDREVMFEASSGSNQKAKIPVSRSTLLKREKEEEV
jgi:hypothetical protein